MDLLDMLNDEAVWKAFFDYKSSKGHLNKSEREKLASFIDSKAYLETANAINADLTLSVPTVKEVNKTGTQKKRTVFSFTENENCVLKLLAYLLGKYDYLFSDNLFSFRKDTGVKKAVNFNLRNINFSSVYSYKADIHDYFNSADTEIILSTLHDALQDEPRAAKLIENIITDPHANRDGAIVTARKGMMAGVPFSGFLANLYLKEMDEWFAERGIPYLRYSDDIIVFAESKEDIDRYEEVIKCFLQKKKLTINESKEFRTSPGETVEFLGFRFSGHEIAISDMSVQKIKAKLKRKARAIYRWRIKKSLDGSKAAKAYIRFLNRKFYDNGLSGEITWCRWYFPIITSPAALEEIDAYAIACIRYLYTGSYGKKNYNTRYDDIKALGFRSLVNSFWRFQHGNYEYSNPVL